MANIQATVSRTASRPNFTQQMPIPEGIPISKQAITSTGSATLSTIAAPDTGWADLHWAVTAYNGPVWVAFGPAASVVASAGNDHYVPSGTTRFFGVGSAGERLSVIDA